DSRTLSYTYGYLGQIYEDEKRYTEAVTLTRRAIFYAQQGKYPQILYLWQWQSGKLLGQRMQRMHWNRIRQPQIF
ncbi:MAG: hypothetical protein HC887_07995, partial [Desulfobacteraceae bacterium]|nr:hypothetical protein [Desulfobacteraceae bacterium]